MFDKLDKESVAGRQGVRLVELFRGMKPDAFGQVSHEDFCRGLVRDFKLTPHEVSTSTAEHYLCCSVSTRKRHRDLVMWRV